MRTENGTGDLACGFAVLRRDRQRLGQLQDCLCRLFLLVGRVAVLAQDTFDQHASWGAHILAQHPVDGHILAH